MTGRFAHQISLLRRWVGPVALVLVLVFSLWMSAVPQAGAAGHGHSAVAVANQHGEAHHDTRSHCAASTAAGKDDAGQASSPHSPVTPCHTASVQIGHLESDSEIPIFHRVVDVLRPGTGPAPSFTVLDPPFTPPRSL